MARTIRRFTEMLGLLARGKFEPKLDAALAEALQTLENLPGSKGSATLTVTINIAMADDRVEIKPKLALKLPEEATPSTTFWPIEGELSVQHPSQTEMFPARDTQPRGSESASA
ncbi:hypothetical protein [Terrihabitans sp. B22-R8]|uniref:hypothetical protein n=1 Tax=Terrihabitans sp. B22-R8 TaxID=3425128 RepID=UPI00403C2E50